MSCDTNNNSKIKELKEAVGLTTLAKITSPMDPNKLQELRDAADGSYIPHTVYSDYTVRREPSNKREKLKKNLTRANVPTTKMEDDIKSAPPRKHRKERFPVITKTAEDMRNRREERRKIILRSALSNTMSILNIKDK